MLRWTGNVTCIEEKRSSYRVLVGNVKERDHYLDIGIGWNIILKGS